MPSTKKRSKKRLTVAKKSHSVRHGDKKAPRITPELQHALTVASVEALKSFIETWDKESPSTIPEPLRIMHEVMQQLGERHHG